MKPRSAAIPCFRLPKDDAEHASKVGCDRDSVRGRQHSQPLRVAGLDNPRDRRVRSYPPEAFALRRYSREFEARYREELGDDELFSSPRGPAEN